MEGYTNYDPHGNAAHVYRIGKAQPLLPQGVRLNFTKNPYVSLQEHARWAVSLCLLCCGVCAKGPVTYRA